MVVLFKLQQRYHHVQMHKNRRGLIHFLLFFDFDMDGRLCATRQLLHFTRRRIDFHPSTIIMSDLSYWEKLALVQALKHPHNCFIDRRPVMNASIDCNNMGIALMVAGQLREASAALKLAAQILYPVSQSFQTLHNHFPYDNVQPQPFSPSNDVAWISSTSVLIGVAAVWEAQVILSQLPEEVPQAYEIECDGFITTQPILLKPVSLVQPTSCTFEACAILFNMGLTYLLARTHSSLVQALCLFETAFNLSQMIPDDARSSELTMRCLNNAGCLHHSLGNYYLSRICLDMLSNYILRLPASTDEKVQKERHSFLLNTMLLQAPLVAAAA